jgi:N-acetylneuraminic acid mutarotase
MLYGGIEDSKDGVVAPNGDIYFMKMGSNDVTWEKQQINGDDKPMARTQHIAVTVGAKNDRVFIFGGHHDPKTRLNDTWFFNTKEMEWTRVGNDKDNMSNAASSIGAPAPRACAAAVLYNNKIYVNGGHGGTNYQRKSFSDTFCFDIEEEAWSEVIPNAGTPIPDGRGGHSLFASGDKLYIYGGWNNLQQYNNIW